MWSHSLSSKTGKYFRGKLRPASWKLCVEFVQSVRRSWYIHLLILQKACGCDVGCGCVEVVLLLRLGVLLMMSKLLRLEEMTSTTNFVQSEHTSLRLQPAAYRWGNSSSTECLEREHKDLQTNRQTFSIFYSRFNFCKMPALQLTVRDNACMASCALNNIKPRTTQRLMHSHALSHLYLAHLPAFKS